jgi:hypothetical protein
MTTRVGWGDQSSISSKLRNTTNGEFFVYESLRKEESMPLIHKRRLWWDSVPEATSYVVYVCKDSKTIGGGNFSWENTPGIISRPVIGKTELIIPDEWLAFPTKPGTYYIAITAQDDLGNQSDPYVLSGQFKFLAPSSPWKGGIDILPLDHPKSGILAHSPISQGLEIIRGGLEEVKSNKEVRNADLGGV